MAEFGARQTAGEREGSRRAGVFVSTRNAVGFLGEVGFFYLGMTFASTTTVVPGFLDALGGSAVLVGLVITLAEGAWRLPQLGVARWLSTKARKKPYLTRAALVARPAYLVYGIALWLGVARSATAAIALFFCLHFLMYASLSIDSLVWWDVFAKAIPLGRRGRMLGASTVLQGALSIGAGAVVAAALGVGGAGFRNPFALLFTLSGLSLMTSLGFWTLVVEPTEAVRPTRPGWRDFLRSVVSGVRDDRAFRRFLAVRLLAGFDGLALGFYALFALRVLNMPRSFVGVFAAVQTLGTVVGGVLFGVVSERFGNRRLIQMATAIGCAAPTLAFLAAIRGGLGNLTAVYVVVFLAMGIFSASLFVGFNNLTVELAPTSERGTYLGVFNTVSGLVVVWPMVGGWLLERTSYAWLFGITGALMVLAHVGSWGMPRRTTASDRAEGLGDPGGVEENEGLTDNRNELRPDLGEEP